MNDQIPASKHLRLEKHAPRVKIEKLEAWKYINRKNLNVAKKWQEINDILEEAYNEQTKLFLNNKNPI